MKPTTAQLVEKLLTLCNPKARDTLAADIETALASEQPEAAVYAAVQRLAPARAAKRISEGVAEVFDAARRAENERKMQELDEAEAQAIARAFRLACIGMSMAASAFGVKARVDVKPHDLSPRFVVVFGTDARGYHLSTAVVEIDNSRPMRERFGQPPMIRARAGAPSCGTTASLDEVEQQGKSLLAAAALCRVVLDAFAQGEG